MEYPKNIAPPLPFEEDSDKPGNETDDDLIWLNYITWKKKDQTTHNTQYVEIPELMIYYIEEAKKQKVS